MLTTKNSIWKKGNVFKLIEKGQTQNQAKSVNRFLVAIFLDFYVL